MSEPGLRGTRERKSSVRARRRNGSPPRERNGLLAEGGSFRLVEGRSKSETGGRRVPIMSVVAAAVAMVGAAGV